MVNGGQDGNNEQMWFAKLVLVVMSIARVGNKSDYAYEETLQRAKALRDLIETIPVNVTTKTEVDNEETEVALGDGNTLALLAPPVS
jgi:hypothetical protein